MKTKLNLPVEPNEIMKTTFRLTVAAIGLATFNVSAATLYVSLESPNPTSPFATWATAATNIQDAVDAARSGDTVLVTNGVYAVGVREGNRVSITYAIRLESVNGPLLTTINGGGSVACVYLGANAVLSGFTLRNGFRFVLGGGVDSAPSGIVTNCTLTGNTAQSIPIRGGGGFGGGMHGGTLYSCTLVGNSAAHGGGTHSATLYNCTVTGNSAYQGGGATDSILYNCTVTGNSGGGVRDSTLYNCTVTSNSGGGASGILYNCLVTDNDGGSDGQFFNCTVVGNDGGLSGTVFNSIVYYNFGGNYAEGTVLNYSCTSPLLTNGVGNITGHPLLMDMAAGDFRLREESPCIDAGTNLMGFPMTEWRYISDEVGYDWVVVGHITDPIDMPGNTRFIDGNFDGRVAWDMGAYEFNSFPPPRFTCAPQRMPDCWRLSITGAPNKWVHVQKSSDLENWEDCWPYVFMGAEGACQWDDGDTSQKAMFYRAVVEQ